MSSTRELLLKMGVPQSRIKFEAFVSPGVVLRSAVADAEPGTTPAELEPLSDAELMPRTATFARPGKRQP